MIESASRGWMGAALGLTLVVGVSLGVALDRFVLTTPEAYVEADTEASDARGNDRSENADGGRHRERLLTRLARELELTAPQQAEVETVLANNRERADSFWKESRGGYRALREELRDAIRAVLTDDQSERFNQMLARDEERRQQRRRDRR